MRKWSALILTVLVVSFVSSVFAQGVITQHCPASRLDDDLQDVQVPIPKSCRVPNRSGVQCVWCSIECLGRYHNVPTVMTLTDKYKYPTSEGPVRRVLDSLNVKYQMQSQGNRNKKFLVDACAKGWGAGVGLNGVHMVNIVHFKDGVVKIINNSDSSLRVQTWTESQFMQLWDGWAITLIPPGIPGGGVTPLTPPTPPGPPLAPRPPSAIG